MNCEIIATGSSGNAVLLHGVLLDCGVPFQRLKPYCDALRLVLLTHRHGDHFRPNTIRLLAYLRPTVRFGCCEWLVQELLHAGVAACRIDVYVPERTYRYDGLVVTPFPLLHDVPNCGYRLEIGGERALYATDTGTLEGVTAMDYDLYLIEANHTEAELEERVRRKLDEGAFVYEDRVSAGHLSREKADAFLRENAGLGSRFAYLHAHREPERAEKEVAVSC